MTKVASGPRIHARHETTTLRDLVLVAITCVVLASCVAPSASKPVAPTVGADLVAYATSYAPAPGSRGGKLVLGIPAPATQLNPFYTSAVEDLTASLPILRGCANVASDGKYIPDLCASLPSSSNGDLAIESDTFSLTLHLKEGLLWSDGQPLTMHDLEFTRRWANDLDQPGCVRCGEGTAWPLINAIDVSPDGLTAKVHFSRLFGGWLEWLTSPIMPEHYLGAIPVGKAAAEAYPLGANVVHAPVSGPFMVKSVDAARIDYTRNPNWHAGVSVAHQGSAYLDELELRFLPDETEEIRAFKAGELDLAFGLLGDAYPAFGEIDPRVGFLAQAPLWAYEHFGLNTDPGGTRDNGLNDPLVRLAIAELVDKEAAATADLPGGRAFVACSPAPVGIWYRKDEPCPSYDPAAASAHFNAAGWQADAAGWLAKGGREMDLQLCTTAGRSTRLGHLRQLEKALRAAGIRTNVLAVDGPSAFFAPLETTTASTTCSLSQGTYDISEFGWLLSGNAYRDWYPTYSSSEWPEVVHSAGNDTRFENAAADAALVRLASDVPLAAQLSDAQVVQDSVAQARIEIPLFYWTGLTGVGIHAGNWPGLNPSPQGPTWDVEDWFFRP